MFRYDYGGLEPSHEVRYWHSIKLVMSTGEYQGQSVSARPAPSYQELLFSFSEEIGEIKLDSSRSDVSLLKPFLVCACIPLQSFPSGNT